MTRTFAAAGCALLLCAGAAACSPPAATDDDAVVRWMDARADDAGADGVLGQATARVGTADREPAAAPGAVALTFDEPIQVQGLRLSCVGDGTVDLTVYVTTGTAGGGTSTEALTYADVACGSTVHEEPLAVQDATGIGFSGSGADRAGAWHAVVVGDDGR
ncbi:hypothetical protein [Cellulomonas endometrii]|uniref:hypothetical protein n=1 Tax=Cellulomonas endometrii TaxID=3036301 RepID=UPI0024AD95CF|nr:hypothetical protein [Cellulomonas endometrii]